MRIAHVTATFPPYYAGTGLVCYHNALELARRGHRVTVYTAAVQGETSQEPTGIEVRRLPPAIRFGNAPLLPGLLGLDGFDIIHLHYPFIFGAELIRLVSQVRRIPYILTYHNDLTGTGLRGRLFDIYSSFSIPLVFEGARKLAVLSYDHASACRVNGAFQKRMGDVVEISNGVDINLFRPGIGGMAVRRDLEVPEGYVVILFVGALDQAHHFKKVDYLLKSFALLEDEQAILMIVGDGDLKAGLVALADDLGISARTRFVGAVPHQCLAQYYSAADLVVLPSVAPESFGMVLIEAMACGKPVIASQLPGVRIVVHDGQDGLLVQPGDVASLTEKIRLLIKDPKLRKEFGARGRSKVEASYTWPKIAERLERVYEEAVS